METTEQNTEQISTKIQIGARIDLAIYEAIAKLARDDERTMSSMIERLLKQSPPVAAILESESVATV